MLRFSRRGILKYLAASAAGLSASGWFPAFADEVLSNPHRKRSCILLWMAGGPSQTDTFDMKPAHDNGGEFREISTRAIGVRFSEHLPRLSKVADRLAVVRGLSTNEGDHGRGSYLMRTGQKPMSPIDYPAIGSSLASQLCSTPAASTGLPPYISVGAFRGVNNDGCGPGFLGPRFGPLLVGATDISGANQPRSEDGYARLQVDSLGRVGNITETRQQRRLELWRGIQAEFLARHATGAPQTQNAVYCSALELMNGIGSRAFDLSDEPRALREKYGPSLFGQSCLLARRLVEGGVPFVEVSQGPTSRGLGWDTHQNNFEAVKQLSAELDTGWSALMTDLEERGLLESTTILWMGEFGRTPRINSNAGRDHYPAAWSVVFGGGGIRGGQAYGRTSDDGTEVVEGKVGVTDVLATLCAAVGVPPETTHLSNTGRPVALVDGFPINDILV